MEEFNTNVAIENICFSDHDVVSFLMKVFLWTSGLKINEIILFRLTKLLGSYWKMWNWYFSKERICIAIYQVYSPSFKICLGIYYSKCSSLEQIFNDFDLQKQKSFISRQIYGGLSTAKTYDNVYCIGEFKKSVIKVNKDALLEYERLKENDLFSA